jgi:putative beta-lysine N-acetyltransferase
MELTYLKADRQVSAANYPGIIREAMLAGKQVKLNLDFLNKRIKVLDYHSKNIDLLISYLHNLGRGMFSKIIVVARENDWQDFLGRGYVLEGVNRGYYRGRPGFYMVKFLTAERRMSDSPDKEDQILRDIFRRSRASAPPSLPAGYSLRNAVPDDIPQIIQLFKSIFASYPSPITDPGYLNQFIKNHIFQVVLYSSQIVSTASADTDRKYLSAEMTDCACLPEHRSWGLMTCLLHSIEQELLQDGFKNLYSIARASQPGINAVLWKLGYNFGGCFINNCTIGGQFENMNLWVKNNW